MKRRSLDDWRQHVRPSSTDDLDCQTDSDLTSSERPLPRVDLGAFSPDLCAGLNVGTIDWAPMSYRERHAYILWSREQTLSS